MTMSEFETKIKKWLETEGYPFEMQVAQAFERAGFTVELSSYYKDFDEGKYREIDVVASQFEYADEDRKVLFEVKFTCECKHSKNKPWVLFSSASDAKKFPEDASGYRHANYAGHVALLALSVGGIARSNRLLMHRERSGFGLVRALDGQSDVAYKAVMSASRAAASMAKYTDETYNQKKVTKIELYFPVVVTTGRLFCYQVNDASESELEELSEGSLIFKNPESGEHFSTIEVVTQSGLENYLSNRADWTKELLEAISNGVGPLRKFLRSPGAGINDS